MEGRMKPERNVPLFRMFLSFILATTIFTIIILISSGASYYNYQRISSQNNIVTKYLNDMDILLNMSTSDCGEDILVKSSIILDEVGGKLDLLEKRFGKKDSRVLEQKKLYSQLELKHFNIIKQIKKQCNEDYITILFFYSNNEPLNEESERMGFILRTFKDKMSDKIMIYSFDYNLNSELIINLKENYNITSAPIAVINEQDKIYVKNIEDLTPYLKPKLSPYVIRLN